jgi:glycosyltransferase involved in cell wall biosynthesis
MSEKLTVLIPCKNEEKNIRPCIESAKPIADELLVADSGSSDRTMDIARALGARIIEREYVNSADFKNWAIPQVSHPWVLVVDADERVTPELAAEVRRLLSDGPRRDGYRIYRASYFFGHRIKRCGWQRDNVLRLFRSELRYESKHVHAEVVVPSGRVGWLKGKLEHYTCWTFDQYFEKFGRYTTWGALDRRRRGRRAGFWSLTVRPAFRFFRQYVLQRGFLDGKAGLVLCGLAAFNVFVRNAKIWGIDHGRPQPDPEADRGNDAGA